MIPNCTTPPGLERHVPDAVAGGLNALRLRMVRDLELFLSYALAAKGEARWVKTVERRAENARPACNARRRYEA